MYDRLIKISKKLAEKRNVLKKQINDFIPSKENSIIFPSYPFPANNKFLQAFPWGHNGFLLSLGTMKFIIDPGYDFLSRCIHDDTPLYAYNSIILSHAHIDHYASINVMIEAISFEQKEKLVYLIAPEKVFNDKIISAYHSNEDGKGKKQVVRKVITNKERIELKGVKIYAVELFHSIEPIYGYIFEHEGKRVGYLSDTGYTIEFETDKGVYKAGVEKYEGNIKGIKSKRSHIKTAFENVDVLVANVNDFVYNKHSQYHLTGFDLMDILKDSNIKRCYITHLNTVSSIHQTFLSELERVISMASGVKTECIRKVRKYITL